jgi:hypothetical protein
MCEACALSKIYRETFSKEKAWREKSQLELVHIDICGPMKENGLSLIFWTETTYTAVYLLNRCPTKAFENKTSFEAWSGGRKSLMNHLKFFGVFAMRMYRKK